MSKIMQFYIETFLTEMGSSVSCIFYGLHLDNYQTGVIMTTSDPVLCPDATFTCLNGECIQSVHMCDGFSHCSDGSDEDGGCRNVANNPDSGPCHNNAFDCGQGQCISMSLVCDHVQHCDDGRDETFCCKNIHILYFMN